MFSQLVKKEIRLQRSNILFALVVFLIWCLDFLFVFTGDRPLASNLLTTGTLAQVVHYFFVLPGLIAIFPMMVGATSVAQERKLGTFDFQATLPASRRMNWIAKTGTALVLVIFAGGVLSWICDQILVWNFRIHDLSWICGVTNIAPIPLRFKGLFPGIFAIFFFSMGIYISSISRDSYRALMAGFGFLGLSFFAQRLIDPAGMLIPLGGWFPDYFIHHAAHYLTMFLLCGILLGMSFINFNPQKTKKSIIFLQIFFWIFVVNITGYFTLHWEFRPGKLIEKESIPTPGFTKFVGSRDIEETFPIIRIPESTIVITSVHNKEDEKRYLDMEGFSRNHGHIIEINFQTGKKRVIHGLFGSITEIDPMGKYYTVKQEFGDRDYHVRKPGIVMPAFLDERLRKIMGSSEEPIILNKLFRPFDEYISGSMIIKTQHGEIVYHEIHNRYPMQEYENILVFRIFIQQEKEYITYILRKTGIPNTFELIDQYNGYHEFFPFSNDGRWYAERRVGMPGECYKSGFIEDVPSEEETGVQIIRTDRATSYTISTDKKFVVLSNFLFRFYRGYLINSFSPVSDNQSLSISKDGKFLFFIRFSSNHTEIGGATVPDGFSKEMEFWILDLENGEEILLEKIKPGFPTHKQREAFLKEKEDHLQMNKRGNFSNNYLQYLIKSRWNNVPFLANAWSDDYKLAVLFDENIYLYRYLLEERRFIPLGSVNVPAEFYPECYLFYYKHKAEMEFYSDETLLIFLANTHSLWKLDLRHCHIEKKI